MYVYCSCGYDSGDRDTMEELQAKVTSDGGVMHGTKRPDGTAGGQYIKCPRCKHTDTCGID